MGSFNLTKSAGSTNQESVILIENDRVYNQFKQQFDRLIKRSVCLKKFCKHHFVSESYIPSEHPEHTRKNSVQLDRKPKNL